MKPDCAGRHFSFEPTGDKVAPWYTVRCLHIGRRFVVEIGHEFHPEWGFVDYVEDLPDGTTLVENGRLDDWDGLVERTRAGDSLQPEAA